ncbi:MAG: response regulator transcription factor [Acidobacteria bacterium]|nr:response regulator transcription factor [Acidobacteriota bacterium]MBV9479043.1 response regulator transcription factor [Acidobacteriota bacterium]
MDLVEATPPSARILLASSDRTLTAQALAQLPDAYEIVIAADDTRALDIVRGDTIDCALLDLRARRDALDVVARLRASGSQLPVMLVAERGRANDGIAGLRAGADDFVVRPLHGTEFAARLQALLRRTSRPPANSGVVALHDIEVNFRSAEVRCGGASVRLSALELRLLRYLIDRRGEVVSRDELLNVVWGYEAMPATRTVDVRIASLRRKLEAGPASQERIVTVHGLGYKFIA